MLRKLIVTACFSSAILWNASICPAGTLPIQYAAPASYETGSTILNGVAAADFNSDGNPDVAVVAADATVILPGNGDGTFQPAVRYPGSGGSTVRTADFNNDDKPDLVITSSSGAVSLLMNKGDGTFLPKGVNTTGGALTTEMVTADLNNDGNMDLAFGHERSNYACVLAPCNPPPDYHDSPNVAVLLGNGDGSFQPATKNNINGRATGIAVLDANDDGRPDLAVINSTTRKVSLLYGLGNGLFQSAVSTSIYTPDSTQNFRTSDINADGIPDLLMSRSSTVTAIHKGLGNGRFDAGKWLEFGERTEVSDLNNDGKQDLLGVSNGDLNIMLGAGNGTFFPKERYTVGGALKTVAVADFNRDGMPDLAFANSSQKTVHVLLHRGVQMASPSMLSFPGVDLNKSSEPQIITITNSIGRTLTINAITTSGPEHAVFSVSPGGPTPCGTLAPMLAPGESCSIQVLFTPTLYSDSSASIVISSDHPVTPAYTIALSGDTNRSALTIKFGGVSTGTVTVLPFTTYRSGPATLYYFSAETVTLEAVPDASARFTGWSGCDSVIGNQCTATMNSHRTVTASFQPALPIALESTPYRFTTLASASASASDSSSFAVTAGSFTEEVLLSRPASYQLRGGCDSSFASCSGTSTIIGALTVRAGSVKLENFKLQGTLRVDGGRLVAKQLTIL